MEYIVIAILAIAMIVLAVLLKSREKTITTQAEQIKNLTSERDVQKTQAQNYYARIEEAKQDAEKRLNEQKLAATRCWPTRLMPQTSALPN